MLLVRTDMGVNDYIEIAQKVSGPTPDTAPRSDHTSQVNFGMGFAARQAERAETPVEAPKIPPLGATPLAN